MRLFFTNNCSVVSFCLFLTDKHQIQPRLDKIVLVNNRSDVDISFTAEKDRLDTQVSELDAYCQNDLQSLYLND